jgi:inner membrane protein
MESLIPSIGPWFWFIAAALLLFGELVMPGIFLMWLGVAAILTGILDGLFHFGWQFEIVVFAVLSLAVVAATWGYVTRRWQPESDQPNLNQRHYSYVGKSYVLDFPIVNGTGRITIDATIWDVEGPDKPVGTRVTVKAVNGMRLVVE